MHQNLTSSFQVTGNFLIETAFKVEEQGQMLPNLIASSVLRSIDS